MLLRPQNDTIILEFGSSLEMPTLSYITKQCHSKLYTPMKNKNMSIQNLYPSFTMVFFIIAYQETVI